MSDSLSEVYRFSWDLEDLQTYPWSHHYVKQPEVLKYLGHMVERHGLRRHMQFNTELLSARWSESEDLWEVELSSGTIKTTYLITALGLLSQPNYPDIPGISSFKGTLCHTARWTNDIQLKDKRVGVIGCGSTGVQVITEIAKTVKSLFASRDILSIAFPVATDPSRPNTGNASIPSMRGLSSKCETLSTQWGLRNPTDPGNRSHLKKGKQSLSGCGAKVTGSELCLEASVM
jgi:hypothetical protein